MKEKPNAVIETSAEITAIGLFLREFRMKSNIANPPKLV
jgi:hypothetical protein